MPTTLQTVTITFPEISLHPSAGHKLRGYFGDIFREYSSLLHNHYETGGYRYQYPLVQYKVVDRIPMLLGLGEGANLLIDLFLKIKELELDGQFFPIHLKNIRSAKAELGVVTSLQVYRFHTLWMALSQQNYDVFLYMPAHERPGFLEKILTGNMLAMMKGLGYRETGQILVKATLCEQTTQFKDQKMLAFHGKFTTNTQLPAFIGLGKAVSRGYGVIGLTA
jgi:hypothetical protein